MAIITNGYFKKKKGKLILFFIFKNKYRLTKTINTTQQTETLLNMRVSKNTSAHDAHIVELKL